MASPSTKATPQSNTLLPCANSVLAPSTEKVSPMSETFWNADVRRQAQSEMACHATSVDDEVTK
jgi:hypothetical protein